MQEVARNQDIFSKAVQYMAPIIASMQPTPPTLYDAHGRPLQKSAGYAYRRTAAKKVGSQKNWIPRRLLSNYEEAADREFIVERSVDLTNNDPHAAGVVDTFATTVVGSGLVPHPSIDPDVLGYDKDKIRAIQARQRAVYQTWSPFADAGRRMPFGAIQFLCQRNLMQYGEYLVLLPMIRDTLRPYALACQVINPLRLRTPSDMTREANLIDGVEIDAYGAPVAYWIQKSELATRKTYYQLRNSTDFMRIPARKGHRWNVLHGFIVNDAEQYRGMPFFTPAMKFFRDLNDYLDAELVSNIVTAAFALFIETGAGQDPYSIANALQSLSGDTTTNSTAAPRYQEVVPGQIMYGEAGQQPHPIAAARPGTTFEPFTKVIKKAIAMALNIPYPVLFKDVESVNFAGFRSAMLDAWRVFMMRREWLGQNLCQRIYTMLMEEAYLRGDLDEIGDFYTQMHPVTRAEWRGSPKGDIEPIKAAQADIQLIQANLKTRAESIAERGGDIRTTFDQLAEEQDMMSERGLTEQAIDEGTFAPDAPDDGAGLPEDGDGMTDDMEDAGENIDLS